MNETLLLCSGLAILVLLVNLFYSVCRAVLANLDIGSLIIKLYFTSIRPYK